MSNYKIKVTGDAKEEIQKLFFELGYVWSGSGKKILKNDFTVITATSGELYYGNLEIDKYKGYKEINLGVLHDLVILKRKNFEDANYKSERTGRSYYCASNKVYEFKNCSWQDSRLRVDYVKNNMIPINNSIDKINWEEALQYFLAGRGVEMLDSHNQWEDMKEFYLHDIATNGNQFRLKPKTLYIESGDYTKEEFNNLLEKFHA